ncbi:MAG: SDR family oxidoreductase [Chloroflexi bacterium]|nr:SDR family oxidoreductase [Chloroflexota bacterium]
MINALITGASRGIGLELTRQLLHQGNRVIATCRNPAQADELQSLAGTFKEQLTILPLDVTHDKAVKEARTAVAAQTSSLDLLINNAGILYRGEGVDNFDPAKMRHTFDVNVVGVMRVTTQFVDLLRSGTNPRIINISSQLGSLSAMNSDQGHVSYNSSKAALNMVSRKLAQELKGDGIVVTAVHPGWVQTDMGGAEAPVSILDSAQGILNVSENLTLADTGKFFVYSGEEHPW